MRQQDGTAASGAALPAAAASAATRPTAVGGINVFDWYREMAQTDKSTRFGVPTAGGNIDRPADTASPGWADTTPVDESAVADLVMDMLPSSSSTAPASCGDYTAGGGTSTAVGGGERGSAELTVTEEDVCAMLRSLNEADLKMLESHLDHDDSATAAKNGAFDAVNETGL